MRKVGSDVVALVLAGGVGSRLLVLTRKRAKPAVYFGGKYRLIDFTLSNCVNSGVYLIGVLTQYRPFSLQYHIGSGFYWDLNRRSGGVTILPPFQGSKESDWYRGTADAVYQNLSFIRRYSPKAVLILSGDHVYKMDYRPLLELHQEADADLTIAAIEVPIEEASRYGILITDSDGRVVEFEEKPSIPKSNLANMGIYVFRTGVMEKVLVEDAYDPTSEHDFGKNVIPRMIKEGYRVYAYRFTDYWQDVGTINSFWESNMELIKPIPRFNLYDPDWPIYTRQVDLPPAKFTTHAELCAAIVGDGSVVEGRVVNSVISTGVRIEKGAVVENSVIFPDVVIKSRAVVKNCIIDRFVAVGEGAIVGEGENTPNEVYPKHLSSGITVVGRDSTIPSGIRIGKNVLIDADMDLTGVKEVPSGKALLWPE